MKVPLRLRHDDPCLEGLPRGRGHEGDKVVRRRNDPACCTRFREQAAEGIALDLERRKFGVQCRGDDVDADQLAVDMFERCPGPGARVFEDRGPREARLLGEHH